MKVRTPDYLHTNLRHAKFGLNVDAYYNRSKEISKCCSIGCSTPMVGMILNCIFENLSRFTNEQERHVDIKCIYNNSTFRHTNNLNR